MIDAKDPITGQAVPQAVDPVDTIPDGQILEQEAAHPHSRCQTVAPMLFPELLRLPSALCKVNLQESRRTFANLAGLKSSTNRHLGACITQAVAVPYSKVSKV